MNSVKIVALIAALAALGIAIGWYGSRPAAVPPPSVASPPPVRVDSVPPAKSEAAPPVQRRTPSPFAGQTVAELPSSPSVETNLVTDWEERLDEVLGSESEEAEKANTLLEMFPRLPEAGKVEVALHLSNLVEDQSYAAFGQYLTNSSLSEEVLDVLLSDVLNRPNAIKLPMLVGVARDPRNPKAAEAKDILELYLEEDYGGDWAAWQAKAEEWLKENPD